jgi:hypothetical protein
MNSNSTNASISEVIFGVSVALVGLGVITVALAPFAIPFVILLAVSLIPFALPAIPVALLIGLWLAVRAIARRVGGRRRRASSARPRTTRAAVSPRVTHAR